ncbi:hypothetical protein SAMN00777080_4180 [Aquiflexum balticum DSM 16537]|uniref:Peptidase M50 domain-containing protein n=1 Tax=Aquiflexum balticum DSM 16537 TaxID=758820 RepID=A0A1W2HAE6_9BACT|nr:M50 family metallopeptidase [Aquiflexum balticum]SMD45526.1 hypothetical protein SAMN00777080_4180 [Aquiflexum balticum DSM 16537]
MRKNLISGLLGALLSVGVFAFAYFFLDQTHIDKFLLGNKIEAIIYFPMLIIAPLSALFMHELGHLLTGLALGQKLKLFVVAFFGIKDEDGRTKVFFNKNLSYFGGIAATVPKTEKDINPNSFSKILLAGPLFSFVYFIVCLLVFFQFDSYLNSFFAIAALTSFGLFLATTLPEKSGIMFTDRKRFQRLNSKGIAQESETAMYELLSKSIIDNSFKNIDIQKTAIMDKDNNLTTKFWAAYLRFMYFRENGLTEQEIEALQKLTTFKSEIPKSIWNTLKID